MKRDITKQEQFLLDSISDLTNRSLGQTIFLFKLCNFDFTKLCDLEEKIQNTFYGACPGDEETVNEVLILEDRVDYFRFDKRKSDKENKLRKLNTKIKELEDKLENKISEDKKSKSKPKPKRNKTQKTQNKDLKISDSLEDWKVKMNKKYNKKLD